MKRLSVFLLFLSLVLFMKETKSQKLDSTALLIIDIQEFYFPGGAMPLSEPEKAAGKTARLLDYFRKNGGLVVHVRHNFEPGGSIHPLVKPLPDEKVYSKNEVNAFVKSDLADYLHEKHIRKLVLSGMQTHMCLEAAARAGKDLGFACTVIEDACATRDLKYKETTIKAADVHFSTLATLKSYAIILTAAQYFGE